MTSALDRLRGGASGDDAAARMRAGAALLDDFAKARLLDGDAPSAVVQVGVSGGEELHRPSAYDGPGGGHAVLLVTEDGAIHLYGATAGGAVLHRSLAIADGPDGRTAIAPGYRNVFADDPAPDAGAIRARLARFLAPAA